MSQGSRPGPGVWQKSALPNGRFDRDRLRAALRARSVECGGSTPLLISAARCGDDEESNPLVPRRCGAPAPLCFPAKRRRESIRGLRHARTPSANESGVKPPHSKDGCAVKYSQTHGLCTSAKLQSQGSRPGLRISPFQGFRMSALADHESDRWRTVAKCCF